MNKAVRIDLEDAAGAIEHLLQVLPEMSIKDKIDACARLRGAAKSLDAFDKAVKDEIKAELRHKDGMLLGSLFKAILKNVQVTRLNQTKLKDERPNLYAMFSETKDESRITFEAR